jgi:hypothetical protein
MRNLSSLLLIGATVLFGSQRARALEFYLDVASHTQGGVTSYVASVHLEADFNDFDDLVDGYVLSSPNNDFLLFVSSESFNDSSGLMFPTFAGMTGALYGDWTLEQTVFGFPFDSSTFRVQSAGLAVGDLPTARILSPANGGTGVSSTPTFTFAGPPNTTGIGVALRPESGFYPNDGFASLPGNATQHTPSFSLDAGLNTFFLICFLPPFSPAKVTVGTPSGVRWSSLVSRAAEAEVDFTVGGSGGEVVLLGPERVGGQFRWSFATETGRTYDVQYNDDLNTSNWPVLQTINGDGGVKSFTVSPGEGARFFRVLRR